MNAETGKTMPSSDIAGSIALGALAVGVLDGLDAVIVWALRGVGPARVFQGIAAGLLGPEARSLGAPAALLGVAIHFFIATVVVAVLVLATRARPRLLRRPLVTGALYGVGVWLVMSFAVVPLAFDRAPRLSAVMVANGLFAHVFLVGLPAVWAARRAARVATLPDRTAAAPAAAEQS
jgi:hypothetical protein